MGNVKDNLENIGGILDIVNSTYDTVDRGVETIDRIKSGSLSENFNVAARIEEKTRHMQFGYYILWSLMLVLTILIWIFL